MEAPTELLCLFNAELTEQNGLYHIEVPRQEIDLKTIEPGEVYRTAVIGRTVVETGKESASSPEDPPVSEGDVRELEIESLGNQGDGIARVERGFVVIVSDTEVGDRVRAKIIEVRENVAFAEPLVGETH